MLSPLTMVVWMGLHLFCRVVQKAPLQCLVVLANAFADKKSWLKVVLANLTRLSEVAPNLEELRGAALPDWYGMLVAHPKVGLEAIQKALSHPNVNVPNFWINTGVDALPGGVVLPPQSCELCPYTCATVQGFSWHKYKANATKHPIRRLVGGTVCVACL